MRKKSIILFLVLFGMILTQSSTLKAQATSKKIVQIAKTTVPDLIGKTLAEAEKILREKGILYQKSFITAVHSQYRDHKGKIVRQSPKAGEKVAKRVKIWIYVYSPKTQAVHQVQTQQHIAIRIINIDLIWKDRFSFQMPGNSLPIMVATIKNQGKDPTPSGVPLEYQIFLFNNSGKEIYRKAAQSRYPLEGGKTRPINFQDIPFADYKSTYWIQLVVDPANKIKETNEKNNSVKMRNLPDLAIQRIWIEDAGSKYKIKAIVSNVGPRLLPRNFSVTWYFDGEKKPPFLGKLGQSYGCDFSCSFNKSSFPTDKKSLVVKLHVNDPSAYPLIQPMKELRMDNNILEVTLTFPDR
jgi:hypothetical protein